VYTHYLRNIGVFLSAATVFFNVVFQGFSIGSNVWLSEWSNDKSMYGNETDDSKQSLYLGVYGALGVGQGKSDTSVLSIMLSD
jgi:ATP-binding cassette subfamily C (CFTR/MRP) protein 1